MLFYDFYAYYATSLLIRKNGAVYDPEALLIELRSLGVDESLLNLSPPWAIWSIAWLSYLPFTGALALWMLINVMALMGSGCLLRQLLNIPDKLRSEFWIVFLAFFPTIKGLFYGQNLFLPLWGGLAAVHLLRTRKYYLAGIFLSLTFFKPHLILLFVVFVLVRHFRETRSLLLCVGFGSGLLAQGLLSWLMVDDLVTSFLSNASQLQSITKSYHQPNLYQFIAQAAPSGWTDPFNFLKALLYLILILALTSLTRRVGISSNETLLIVLPTSVFLSPYSWSHDFIFFAPLFICIAFFIRKSFTRPGMLLFLVAQVLLSAACFIEPRNERWIIAYPLALLLSWYLIKKRNPGVQVIA